MHKDTAEIFIILLDAAVKGFDIFLFQEPQHPFFQLAAALAWNDFHQPDFLGHGFLYNAVELCLNGISFIENVVQVQFEFGHYTYTRMGMTTKGMPWL